VALGGFHIVAGELVGGIFQDCLAAEPGDPGVGFVVPGQFLQQFGAGIETDASAQVLLVGRSHSSHGGAMGAENIANSSSRKATVMKQARRLRSIRAFGKELFRQYSTLLRMSCAQQTAARDPRDRSHHYGSSHRAVDQLPE
jgi:hypothetical protein